MFSGKQPRVACSEMERTSTAKRGLQEVLKSSTQPYICWRRQSIWTNASIRNLRACNTNMWGSAVVDWSINVYNKQLYGRYTTLNTCGRPRWRKKMCTLRNVATDTLSKAARISIICFDYEVGLFSKTPCYVIFYDTGSLLLEQIKVGI